MTQELEQMLHEAVLRLPRVARGHDPSTLADLDSTRRTDQSRYYQIRECMSRLAEATGRGERINPYYFSFVNDLAGQDPVLRCIEMSLESAEKEGNLEKATTIYRAYFARSEGEVVKYRLETFDKKRVYVAYLGGRSGEIFRGDLKRLAEMVKESKYCGEYDQLIKDVYLVSASEKPHNALLMWESLSETIGIELGKLAKPLIEERVREVLPKWESYAKEMLYCEEALYFRLYQKFMEDTQSP